MSAPAAPAEVREQLGVLVSELESILGNELVGVYLHGSLALGCFNPQRSDIDLIAVTRRRLNAKERRRLGALMLRSSGARERPREPPYPLEVSILRETQLNPWRYPTPFDFHYGESHRDRFTAGEFGPLWGEDHDLAAHITVIREAGVTLAGPSIDEVFPTVPWADYADSLLRDLVWSRERRLDLYGILNASRIWATFAERRLHSKLSGGIWALENAPKEFHRLIAVATAVYRGESQDDEFEPPEVLAYVSYVETLVRSIASR
jgi:streptomycin 3"-adenylyltransferase